MDPAAQTVVQPEINFQGPLAEFSALRQEIQDASGRLQALTIFQITTSGAIFSFALSGASRTAFLLIVPMITYLLLARYMILRGDIVRIAQYIDNDLSGKIPGGLAWEAWSRRQDQRIPVLMWLHPTLVTFPGIGIIALVAATPAVFKGWAQSSVWGHMGLLAIWLIGAVMLTICVSLVWRMSIRPFVARDAK